jgi:anti-sigma-K factor RskA
MSADVNSHEIWRERAALHALGALAGEERREFEAHLQTCMECAAELSTLRPAVDALAQAVPSIEPRPELRDRVMTAALEGPRAVVSSNPDARTLTRVKAARPSPLMWLSAAAMLLAAIGLGVYANGLRNRVARLEVELDDARAQSAALQARVGKAESALTAAQTQVTSTQSQLDVLTAPDTRRIALAGQAGAPGASGRADWSPSRGLAVSVANLPPLLPMRTYQVWLLTRGNPVSAGLLPADASSGRTVVFANPAGAPDPIGVALSEEPAGGGEQPSNRIYLVGLIARR